MEEIVYLSIRLGCTAYLLYKVWEQKKRIGKICDLLYTPRKKPEMEKDHHRNPENAADVMGATRFVYLDENAGKTVAPYMSQQLEMGSDLIGKDEDIPEDEVECKLPLEEMRMLKDEQEKLDSRSPETEAIVPAVTPADLLNVGEGDTGQSPMACGIDQLPRAPRARFQGLAVSTRSPGRIALGSAGPWCRPAVLHDSGECLKNRGVYPLSWVTRAQVRGHEGTSSCPGGPGAGSEGPRGRPAVPGVSCLGPRTPGSTAVPGDSGPDPWARIRPAILGASGASPMSRGVTS